MCITVASEIHNLLQNNIIIYGFILFYVHKSSTWNSQFTTEQSNTCVGKNKGKTLF